jgi:hypothetical protein
MYHFAKKHAISRGSAFFHGFAGVRGPAFEKRVTHLGESPKAILWENTNEVRILHVLGRNPMGFGLRNRSSLVFPGVPHSVESGKRVFPN